jgi:glycogen(starch) synthase
VRVLLVANQFFPVVGGIENFLRAYAPALREGGHDVAVLTSRHALAHEPIDDYDGIPVFRSDLERALAARDITRVHQNRRWIEMVERDWAPDVVHAHDTGPQLWAYLRTPGPRRAPTIVTIQTSMPGILDPVSLPLASRLLEACEWVTAVSRAVLDEARRLAPGIADRSSVVPNAVPIPANPPVAPPAAPRVLCLGRLVEQKGFDVAVAAVPHLVEQVPAATLTIAGDGEKRGDLAAMANAMDLADRIDFVGVVPHDRVAALIDSASVVAMPSRYEGLPLVYLEAATRARPVVGTSVHGLGEIIEHGRTGLLVPPEDPQALAEALGAVLRNPTLARSLGTGARDLVTREYSMTVCLDAYTELYRAVVGAGPRHAAD